jgi:hypothetical protein
MGKSSSFKAVCIMNSESNKYFFFEWITRKPLILKIIELASIPVVNAEISRIDLLDGT